MLNAGFGETQLNSFLTTLNIPPMSARHLKKREREVGEQLEKLAQESCDNALQEEGEL